MAECSVCGREFENGASLRNHKSSGHEEPYKDKDVMYDLYINKELSTQRIAEILDTTPPTVFRWLNKLGIETRSQNQAIGEKHPAIATTKRGYEYITATGSSRGSKVHIHRVVACLENDPNDVFAPNMNIHHKNGIPWDNRPENLQLLSADGHTKLHKQGENNPNADLTNSEAEEIRRRYEKESITQKELGSEYGVSMYVVNKIVNGVNYTNE